MTRYEAFKKLFNELSFDDKIAIYMVHSRGYVISKLDASVIDVIFESYTPYQLLTLFHEAVSPNDDWIIEDFSDNRKATYSCSDKELKKTINSSLREIYEDYESWEDYFTNLSIQNLMYKYAIDRVRDNEVLDDMYYVEYYVKQLDGWEYDKSDEYNFQKIILSYEDYKKFIETETPEYMLTADDENDFRGIETKLLQDGYLDIDNY